MDPSADPSEEFDGRAALGRRIGAALIDVLILSFLFAAFTSVAGESETTGSGASFSLSGLPFILYLASVFAYYWGLESRNGQTLGKMVTGVRVVSADGSELTEGQTAGRTALRVIDGFPILYLVGLAAAFFTGRKAQRIGDMAANTMVVSVDRPTVADQPGAGSGSGGEGRSEGPPSGGGPAGSGPYSG